MAKIFKRKNLLYLLFWIVIIVPITELALRMAGYGPYSYVDYTISSKPANCLMGSNTLGIALNPGKFDITINKGLKYSVTHNADSIRGHSVPQNDSSAASIYLFGCSFTYGMGVNDDEVMSEKLRSYLSNQTIYNYGVPGFGNLQGFLQLKKLVREKKSPSIAIFNYADFHPERNVMSPTYRIHLDVAQFTVDDKQKTQLERALFPYVNFSEGKLHYKKVRWSEIYKKWPGRETFALVNFVQSGIDNADKRKLNPSGTTVKIFRDIASFCDKNNIRLIVTGLTQSVETRLFLLGLKLQGIETVDISLPMNDPKYNHYPYDTHPNAVAHDIFAKRISQYLKTTRN